MPRKSLLAAICAALLLFATSPAEASFHKKADRDSALAQVTAIVDTAEQSGKLTPAQVSTIRAEVAVLKQKDDGLTTDDLARVDRIRQTFAAANLKSVLLDKAQVFVAKVMDNLRHQMTHVIKDHGGRFE